MERAMYRGGKPAWLLAALVFFMWNTPGRANVFFISSPADTTNVTSLRGAIIAANHAGGNNIIILTNGTYALTNQGVDETASFTGDLDVTNGSLVIVGTYDNVVTITATNLGDRVFHVLPNAELTLLNLIIRDGAAPGGIFGTLRDAEQGGGILNEGGLILEDCVLTNNASGAANVPEGNIDSGSGADGGAIYNLGELTMFDCVVSGNFAGDGFGGSIGGNGGGVVNAGSCQMEGCVFSNNSAGAGSGGFIFPGLIVAGSSGGAIFNNGEMTLDDCEIRNNLSGDGSGGASFNGLVNGPGSSGSPGGSGGGIYNEGALALNGCTISGNICGDGGDGAPDANGGAGGNGAGIYSLSNLTLVSCTLSGNVCGNGGNGGNGAQPNLFSPGDGGVGGNGGTGGGIFNMGSASLLACTISQNSGGLGGAGSNGIAAVTHVFEKDSNGNFVVVTVYLENAPGGAGGNGGMGGLVNASTNEVDLRDVLISANVGAAGGPGGDTQTTNGVFIPVASGSNGFADVAGQFVSQGHNLIGQGNGSGGFTNGVNGDLLGTASKPLNAMLGPLADNGGVTETCNLLPGSPAIDAGDDGIVNAPTSLTTDQRGQARLSGAHVDIGAVEYDGIVGGVVQSPIFSGLQSSGGGFQFNFNAATQIHYDVFASSNLKDWTAIGAATELSRGWFTFEDEGATNFVKRFYRVRF